MRNVKYWSPKKLFMLNSYKDISRDTWIMLNSYKDKSQNTWIRNNIYNVVQSTSGVAEHAILYTELVGIR